MRRRQAFGAALAFAAVVGGVALRFVAESPYWLDEALSVHIASGTESLADALRRDGHPALYYLILGWWIDGFGDSEVATRALSGLLSLATVPFVWAVARRHGRDVAGATALLALSSPYLLRYGTETRMYALVAFLVAVGWWAIERARQVPSLARLALVAGTTAALVHTHYWSFFVVAAAFVMTAVWWWREVESRAVATKVMAAVAVGAASLLVWIDVFFDQLAHTGTPWAKRARPTEILVETLQGIGGNNRFEGETLGIVMLILALIGALAIGVATDGRLTLRFSQWGEVGVPATATALTLTLGAAAAIITAGAFEARYAAVVIPFVLVLAGRGVAVLPDPVRYLALALVVLMGLAVGVDEARRTRSQGQEVAEAINAGASTGDHVVFCPDQLGPATVHYLDPGLEVAAFPGGDGVTVDWRDYIGRINATPAAVFAGDRIAEAGDNAIWFVGSTGYRGFENRCGELSLALDAQRSAFTVVATQNLFENMFLIRYEP